MEEIEYKLSLKSPTLILNGISKLINIVENALEVDPTTKINELPEMKLLKQLYQHADPIVSQTACHGIVALVKGGALSVTSTLSEFMASIPFIVNFNGIVTSITSLIVLQIKNDKAHNDTSILKSVHHPFVMLFQLKKTDAAWFDILCQMKILCNHEDKDISSIAIRLLHPVFLYILCDPSNNLPIACRQQSWALLQHSAKSHDDQELVIDVLSWLQMHSDDSFKSNSSMYLQLAELALGRRDIEMCVALAPSIASLVHSSLKQGHDPHHCLSVLKQLLTTQTEANSCVLILLANSLSLCPAIYFSDVLTACLVIVEQGSHNVMSAQMLFCAILPWLVFPSQLATNSQNLLEKLLGKNYQAAKGDSKYLCMNEWFCQLQNTDGRVDFAMDLCKLSEIWEETPDKIVPWLERLIEVPEQLTDEFHLFLCALLLNDFKIENVKQTCLKILLMKAARSSEMAVTLLPLLLYKISREEQPLFLVELLRGLTSLAVHKENIAVIVSTLESLKREESLQCFVINLYLRLWQIENRCYSYLQPFLVQTKTTNEDWKLDISRVAAIKHICKIRPEQYGTELVALLSQILSRCVDESQSLAAALALQGITSLCQADIVDIATTWRVLAPRLSGDSRRSVVVSLCDFFGVIPSLHGSGVQYERLCVEVVTKLWDLVSSSDNSAVITAALEALGKFDLGHMSVQTLPDKYRVKPAGDAAQKPEEVPTFVPGGCWMLLLQNVQPKCLQSAGRLLIGWISAELNEYRSGVYQIPLSGEPSNYHHLRQQSVLRAVADHIRLVAKNQDLPRGPVELECLRILSHNYSKPLPPFNWSCLQELATLQTQCLTLAAKQALTSPSARRFIDNHLSTFQPTLQKKEEILELFTMLGDLCKGIPPTNLRPSVEKSLLAAMQEDDLLTALLDHVKTALLRTDIHEANRSLLAAQVEALLPSLGPEHPVFSTYVRCVEELPMEHVERMSSPSLWFETSSKKLRQAMAIRGALACRMETEVPLTWLNECIDATTNRVSEQSEMLREVSSVVIRCRSHATNWRWILELLGRIQSVISADQGQQSAEYLCNILMMSVIILAAHDIRTSSVDNVASSLETRLSLFPQAMATLSARETDKDSALVMEWLHSMQGSTAVSSMYNSVFRQGLLAMRHRTYFQKPSVPQRFINKT